MIRGVGKPGVEVFISIWKSRQTTSKSRKVLIQESKKSTGNKKLIILYSVTKFFIDMCCR